MGFSFMPKDDTFFKLLLNQIEISHSASKLLLEIGINPKKATEISVQIKEKEHESDHLLKSIAEKLNQSFFTPIDREDIYILATQLDDIMDEIDEVSKYFSMYNITKSSKEAIDLLENLVSIIDATKDLINNLNNLKNTNDIDKAASDIDKFENIADVIYYNSVSSLYKEETNPIEILKWEKIYSALENTTNQCKEIAHTIHKVVIKHL